MVRLYADEQFPRIATEYLRSLGHDVLTVQEAGNAGKSDPEVLAFAIADNRAILTQNRRDFVRLHRETQNTLECSSVLTRNTWIVACVWDGYLILKINKWKSIDLSKRWKCDRCQPFFLEKKSW